MQKAIVVKGRLINQRTIPLDEPVSEMTGEVEVILRPVIRDQSDVSETLSAWFHRLPAGMRTKEDMDGQIREERDSWGAS